jgi:hypothetical protein
LKAHEIYQAIDPQYVTRMLDWFREHDRNVYRSAVSTLAEKRRLRLVFIQKKSLADQYAWILKNLRAKANDPIGEHLLQAWLMAGHQDMLAQFCDAMGIEHDGKGAVTGDLPEELDPAALDAAVDALLEKFEAPMVRLYLTLFNLQRPDGWEPLAEKLDGDERLGWS